MDSYTCSALGKYVRERVRELDSVVRTVLVTGSRGYVGSVLVPHLRALGFEVVEVDLGWFDEWRRGITTEVSLRSDVRELGVLQLEGIDAIVHLAALSNDPLGALDVGLTREINLESTVRLATLARQTGVKRFIFASSCSIYGHSGSAWVDEYSEAKPLTTYAESKWLAEQRLLQLTSDEFSPVILRLATVYGFSPSMRLDLVANNLTAWAVTTGRVELQSDGRAWRPLVHVRDVARVIGGALQAPADALKGEILNVGAEVANYTVLEIAEAVCAAVPGARICFSPRPQTDERSYRVRFGKLAHLLPSCIPSLSLRDAVVELAGQLREVGLDATCMTNGRFYRLSQLRELQRLGLLDRTLRWCKVFNRQPKTGERVAG